MSLEILSKTVGLTPYYHANFALNAKPRKRAWKRADAGLYRLDTLRATGRPVHRNCGLVTETKPERTNGDSKSRPPRAWNVCYSHYQNSFDWTTSFFSDAFIV